MKKNRLKSLWAEGRPVLNAWLSIASPFGAEIMAEQNYDSITVDLQHGAIDYQAGLAMLQAMRHSQAVPMARVPWLDPAPVMKMLDAGVLGIICPMINSSAEARRLVSYVRYPPDGIRSYGPTRANFAAGPGYGPNADEEIICLAMIETTEAMENLEEICATPGLDGVYVGPADLSLGLTGRRYRIGFDREEPELVAAIQRIVETAHAAGKRAGLHNGTPEYAARAVEWGYDLVTISNDVRLLAGAAENSIDRFRGLIGETAGRRDAAGPGAY